mgnify:FL=1
MKNQNGISLIALIITIIVIIILAAIVIGGVFNTPNDAKFANFCQEYDRVQTAITLRYYDLYQKYAIDPGTSTLPTHYDIYEEVATGTKPTTSSDESKWVDIAESQFAANKLCDKPSIGAAGWFLRTADGKLAYKGFEKAEKENYYTPSIKLNSRATLSVENGELKPTEGTLPTGLEKAPSAS